MCPFCLTTLGLIALGAASTGGLAEVVVKGLSHPADSAKPNLPARRDPVSGEPRRRANPLQIKRGEMIMATTEIENPRVVSRDEWLVERKELLAKEKALTRRRDALAAERRQLPWAKIDKQYVFDAPEGKVTLADLFDGRSQLFIKHFMMGPGASAQCVGCSFEVDHVEGILEHLQNHDVTYAVVARAPIEEIEVVRKRMGWKFRWVSSYHSDFNYDFNVSFTPEQIASGRAVYNFQKAPEWAAGLQDLSGDSVFFKDSVNQIYLTYATFGRGGEEFLGAYRILDVIPKGRNENGPTHSLADWVRPRNMYGKGGMVEANGRYHQPGCACAAH
jgi:predicted dithiol-disulfide oxidoreductase (DUF899 family)